MKLNINDDLTVENPEVDLIRQKIESLQSDEFAILERGDQFYVQTCRNDDGMFQLEFRTGSEEEHYETTVPAGIDDVEQAFIRYVSNMTGWQEPWDWQKVDFSDVEVVD